MHRRDVVCYSCRHTGGTTLKTSLKLMNEAVNLRALCSLWRRAGWRMCPCCRCDTDPDPSTRWTEPELGLYLKLKRSRRAVRPRAAPQQPLDGQHVYWQRAKQTSDVVIRNSDLWNDVGALRKASLNEVLVFLQRFFDHLQLCVHVGHKEVFNPAVWQGQRLQLGRKQRHTHTQKQNQTFREICWIILLCHSVKQYPASVITLTKVYWHLMEESVFSVIV